MLISTRSSFYFYTVFYSPFCFFIHGLHVSVLADAIKYFHGFIHFSVLFFYFFLQMSEITTLVHVHFSQQIYLKFFPFYGLHRLGLSYSESISSIVMI